MYPQESFFRIHKKTPKISQWKLLHVRFPYAVIRTGKIITHKQSDGC